MRFINRAMRQIKKSGQVIRFWRNGSTIALGIFCLAALILAISSLSISLTAMAQEAAPPAIIDSNDQVIMTNPLPLIIENQIMVPISTLAGALQMKVVWDSEQQTATVSKGKDILRLRIDSSQARINGQELPLGTAVSIIDDRVYVPLVSVATALGAKLQWDEDNRTVKLLPGTVNSCNSQDKTSPRREEGTLSANLTVKAGYFGTPYNTMKVFTLNELEAMPQVQQAYTFIDSMPSVILDSAQGVKLSDILHSAGIDINSIDTLYFYTTDVEKGWYQSLPKSFLLDTRRYYYPNLPIYWDYDENKALPGAEEGAVEVEPIIAIRDYWKRFATSPDFSQMDESNGLRLLFGQVDTSTITSMRSAKWIHEISVMLVGQPPGEVRLNQHVVHALIGSTVVLEAMVGPTDASNKSVNWSSSNPEIASVDNSGQVSIVSPGTATITATTVEGKLTANCVVHATANLVESQRAVVAGSTQAREEQEESDPVAMSMGKQRLANKSDLVKSEQLGKIFELSADIIPLKPRNEYGNANLPIGITSLILFCLGAGRKYKEYKKEVSERNLQ
ncbi:Ig-like domain-containing protein [Syntrophomonas wolfei]|nr:stalk domain-containing protein [Syntrophomonas wolfei]